MLQVILCYFCIISFVAVIVTVSDKISAIKRKERTSENLLMFISIIGGALAMYLTMILINHKTRHNKFMMVLPLLLTTHIIIAMLIYINL